MYHVVYSMRNSPIKNEFWQKNEFLRHSSSSEVPDACHVVFARFWYKISIEKLKLRIDLNLCYKRSYKLVRLVEGIVICSFDFSLPF